VHFFSPKKRTFFVCDAKKNHPLKPHARAHTHALLINDASRDHDHDQMRRGDVHSIFVVVVVVVVIVLF
jgi:hypothetical protein